jgi:hypothetical protein
MGSELVRPGGDWRARFSQTLEALAMANGNNMRRSAYALAERLPGLLRPNEQLWVLFQALRRDNVKSKVVVALTDKRYLLWNEQTGQLLDDVPIAQLDVPVFTEDLWHGNRMELSLPRETRALKQLLPAREAARFYLLARGDEPPAELTALMGGAPPLAYDPPIASCCELTLYPDRLLDHESRNLPLCDEVTATVDTAGSIAVTRGRNLAAKGAGTLLLGPVGLFMAGNAKHRQVDNRELYLLVEGPEWAYTQAFHPDLGELLRNFAQKINVAARQAGKRQEAASSTSDAGGLAAQLRELAELREQGVLTDEEFSQGKAKLLAQG